ncbi:MAG: hypothetical protein KUL85_16485 [Sphingobacterium mizutaii]|nr:hypothetical protein [Sphingobacterium mizutaii]
MSYYITQSEIFEIESLAKDIFMRMSTVNKMYKGSFADDPNGQLYIRLKNIDTLFSKFCNQYWGNNQRKYSNIKLQIYFISTNVQDFVEIIKKDLSEMSDDFRFKFSVYA